MNIISIECPGFIESREDRLARADVYEEKKFPVVILENTKGQIEACCGFLLNRTCTVADRANADSNSKRYKRTTCPFVNTISSE